MSRTWSTATERLDKGYLFTDIGTIEVVGSGRGIVAVTFVDAVDSAAGCATPVVQECLPQLGQYFGGTRTAFTVPLDLRGTDFRLLVSRAWQAIPFGQTTTSGAVAGAVARPRSAHAVGGAVGANPVSIIVPCHRVIGSDGSLTGYGGGLDRKRWLLEHERRILATAA